MGVTDRMPNTVRRAEAIRCQEYLRVVELERKLKRKTLEDPGPKPPPPPPSSWGASSIAREATAENLLADAGELMDRQDKLNEAMVKLFSAVSAAGGGRRGRGQDPGAGRPAAGAGPGSGAAGGAAG